MAVPISKQIDVYYDRTRKNIQQWLTAFANADYQIVDGVKYMPTKKDLQDIFDYATLDTHLAAVMEQRKSKVTGEEFGVFRNGDLDEETTNLLEKKWFSKLQDAIIESRFYGYNLIEIQELVNNEIKDIKTISRGNVIPEFRSFVKKPYQNTETNLISIDNRNDSDYYILIDGEKGHGLLNSVVPLCIIKRITIAYWSEHAMTFGIPPVILKTPVQSGTRNQFHADLDKFVHSRKMIIGSDDDLTVLQTAGSDPHNIYKELIETCNAEISKAIIGQTSSTDVKSYVGSAEVHERVANEISEADRDFMTHAINDIVFPKLTALGYNLEGATFKYISKEKRSYTDKLSTIKGLREAGYSIEPENIKMYLDLPFDVELPESTETGEPTDKKKVQP